MDVCLALINRCCWMLWSFEIALYWNKPFPWWKSELREYHWRKQSNAGNGLSAIMHWQLRYRQPWKDRPFLLPGHWVSWIWWWQIWRTIPIRVPVQVLPSEAMHISWKQSPLINTLAGAIQITHQDVLVLVGSEKTGNIGFHLFFVSLWKVFEIVYCT